MPAKRQAAWLSVETLGGRFDAYLLRDGNLGGYPEHEHLKISSSAPAVINTNGKRGVLAWTFDIGPGDMKAVTLEHLIR